MARVLVTGCAGYIGSVLCHKLLGLGHNVVGIDNLSYDNGQALAGLLGERDFEFVNGDVRDDAVVFPYLFRSDIIMPLAAVVGQPACDLREKEASETNYEAVRRMTTALSARQRVIYPNTNSGYGRTDGVSEVTEKDPLNPVSLYGKTKCDAEKCVLDAGGVSLRLATVFGPSPRMRYDLMVNDFVLKLYGAAKARALKHTYGAWFADRLSVYEPHFKRNFVHVNDVCGAFCRMVYDTIHYPAGAYNVGLPNANLSKWELAKEVCAGLGLSPDDYLVEGQGTDPDQRNYVVSNSKLLSGGFVFGSGLAEGIRQVAALTSLLNPVACLHMNNVE